MTTLSTPLNRVAPRARLAGPAIMAIVLAVIVVAAAIIVLIAAAAGIGGSNAGYDAPFYSQYLEEISASW